MNCDSFGDWKFWLCLGLYSAVEFWIGRTKKVSASSVPELVLTVVVVIAGIISYAFRKKGKQDGQ